MIINIRASASLYLPVPMMAAIQIYQTSSRPTYENREVTISANRIYIEATRMIRTLGTLEI